MNTIEKLTQENDELKRKLEVAKKWMQNEVREHVKKISKNKFSKFDAQTKNTYIEKNIEDVITEKIINFFGEILLLNIPSTVIDNIISAEINYFNLKENPNSDGLGVITSYQKCLDIIIENFITKQFRKFAKKKLQIYLRKNDPLEKSLNLVVNKGYILGVGRLYHILSLINKNSELYDYGKCFKQYLEKYNYISDIILKKNFIKNFEKLITSEVLGKKRHIGKITLEETKQARKLLIGDFENNNCIIYDLCEISKIDC